MTFENLFKILLVLSCVDAKQFGTSAGDKSQKRGDKSRQPIIRSKNRRAWSLVRRLSMYPSTSESCLGLAARRVVSI